MGEYFGWAVTTYSSGSILTAPSVYILIASTFLVFEAIDTEDVDPSVAKAQKVFLPDVILVAIYLVRFFLIYTLIKNGSPATEFDKLTTMSAILAVFFLLEGAYQIILVYITPRGDKIQRFLEFWRLARRKDLEKKDIVDHVGKRIYYLSVAVVNTVVYTSLAFASYLPDFLAFLGPLWTIVVVHAALAILYALTWRVHFYSK